MASVTAVAAADDDDGDGDDNGDNDDDMMSIWHQDVWNHHDDIGC